ncbi:MAG: tetratricopeptide repeat protein [Gammaproteobacteria bacterium]|nr:tetratricopeptide repeat protein [Gammaproteobacteria bacterium]
MSPGFVSRLVIIVVLVLSGGCRSVSPVNQPTGTLSDIDIASDNAIQQEKLSPVKSTEDIRKAYSEYLNNANVDEKTRLNALTRLAELEYQEGRQTVDELSDEQILSEEEKRQNRRLERTIELLSTSIRDYPAAANNDVLLYQLARAQSENGQHEESIESLTMLAEKYPHSPYYVEAQFRVAEDSFSLEDYTAAEYAYSEVIVSPGNDIFLEKSIFKRGWARFKQEYYSDAIEDFIEAVLNHNFDTSYEALDTADKNQIDEYIRAIALSFTYQDDSNKLAEYLKSRPEFSYSFHIYQKITDLFLKQERFSDAVDIQNQFIHHFKNSEDIPYAYLRKIEIWKDSGFNQQIYAAIEGFYLNFNPDSGYWVTRNENSKVNRVIRRSLREYIVLMTGYFHNRYQSTKQNVDYQQADNWYRRYFKYYSAYARQDNTFFLYGELLSEGKNQRDALNYYELAAFDNEQILHKESAYAAIVLSNQLFNSSKDGALLDKYILYTKHFCRQFADDNRGYQISLHAAEQAYLNKQYRNAIELSDLSLENNKNTSEYQAMRIKASSYFNLKQYETAETLYTAVLANGKLSKAQRQQYRSNLALSIYRMAEASARDNDIARAIHHFSRISTIVASTAVASTGLYDAIALNMQHKQWKDAISLIQRFQKLYPRHKYRVDVSKKLSTAYLSSNQGIKAAAEFEKIARIDNDLAVKAAAQWKAAQLYEEKGKLKAAIQAYKSYASSFRKPYDRQLGAMEKVASLYALTGSHKTSRHWFSKIIKSDSRVLNNVRSDSSRLIASNAYLSLARHGKNQFDSLKLTLPLKKTLRRKKTAMQSAVRLFGKASLNKIYDVTTEATYSIASIYQDFSRALLDSDRPSSLNEEELDQYEILLEDQAFPFEDKSIEFFEINLARIREGLYNDWIEKSYLELKKLFPVRYDRQPKIDIFVSEMD